MANKEPTTAIIALTKNGAELGARLFSILEGSELFVSAHRGQAIAGAHIFNGGVSNCVAQAFKRHDRLLLIFSLGIAVRLIARHLENKRSDPAVVVMDEKGTFAISLLSGHVGGANAFAKQVAQMVGAIPVISTASDVNDTVAVDLLGKAFGWEIEDWTNVTRASAAVVNGETVGVFQDAGEAWCTDRTQLPPNVRFLDDIAALSRPEVTTALLITDQLVDADCQQVLLKSVVYRPKSLVVGLGCNRGTSLEEIEDVVRTVLLRHKLSLMSVRNFATIDVKQSEDGLVECARRLGLPVVFYAASELDAVQGVANPSETVCRAVGCRSVCEAAALLSSGASDLVVAKVKSGNVTAAVARLPYGGYEQRGDTEMD